MKTKDLIQALSEDMKRTGKTPGDSAVLSRKNFAAHWFVGAVMVFLLSLKLLPVREDLVSRFQDPDFGLLCVLWLTVSGIAAFRAFRSVFPSFESPGHQIRNDWLAFIPFFTVTAWTVAQFPLSDFTHEWSREQSYLNGGCGAVILVAGLLHAFVMAHWLKKGAPTSLFRTGAWTAISTGAFTSFIIQFACGNEHPIHVMLWHALPLGLLSAAFGALSTRLLKW